jgi:acyl carrier protein
MTRGDIFDKVSRTLVEMFELDSKSVTLEARLFEDLDLDSIDAIDLAAKMQEFAGRRLTEDELRKLRTVTDVVDLLEKMLGTKA